MSQGSPVSEDRAWETATRPGAFDWVAILVAIAAFGLLVWVILMLAGIGGVLPKFLTG